MGSKSGRSTTAGQTSHGQNGEYTSKRFQQLDEHAYPLRDTYSGCSSRGRAEGNIDAGDQEGEEQAFVSDPGDRKSALIVEDGWDVRNNVVQCGGALPHGVNIH